jgi:hypothetical protein
VQSNQGGLGFIPQFEHRIIKIKMNMNIKSLVVSIFSLAISFTAIAEKQVTDAEIAEVLQMIGKDSNQLLKTGAGYSLEKLNKDNKLAPFAIIMNNDGSIGKLEPIAPFIVKAPTNEKINYLRGQIKNFAEKGEIKAGALFSRGFGRSPSQKEEIAGLIVESEHRNGPSTVQFVPLIKENGLLVAKDPTAQPKPRLFFNKKISSDETYKQIKQAISQAESK